MSPRRHLLLYISFFICFRSFPTGVFAWNSLPLLAESPYVIPSGSLRFDVGLQYLNNKNFPFSPFSDRNNRDVLSFPTLGFHIGLGKQVELQMVYEVLFVEEEEFLIREVWKSGDIAFFTKILVLPERKILPGIGVKIGAKLPNARDQYRVGTDETDLAFLGLFEKRFSALTVTSHLGLLILGNPYENAQQDDLLSYNLAVTFPWHETMDFTIEIAGQAFGTSHNEQASTLFHLHFYDGSLIWNLSGRAGLSDNSEDWGLAGGVRIKVF